MYDVFYMVYVLFSVNVCVYEYTYVCMWRQEVDFRYHLYSLPTLFSKAGFLYEPEFINVA